MVGCYLGFPETLKKSEKRQWAEFNLTGLKESGITIVVIVLDYLLRGISRTKLGEYFYKLVLLGLGSYWKFRVYEYGILDDMTS